MTAIEQRPTMTEWAHGDGHGYAPPRVYLQPIAAPSILGLYGFAGATFTLYQRLGTTWQTTT